MSVLFFTPFPSLGGDLLAGMSDATGIDARFGTLDALKIVAASPGLGDSI